MNAVTKLNTRPQDGESTQGKVGHHNVTRGGVRKSQEPCAVPVSVTQGQHFPCSTCLTVLETLWLVVFPQLTESMLQRVCHLRLCRRQSPVFLRQRPPSTCDSITFSPDQDFDDALDSNEFVSHQPQPQLHCRLQQWFRHQVGGIHMRTRFLGDQLLRLGRHLYPQVLHVHVFRLAQRPAADKAHCC